jgi:hypothetical protein
MSEPMRPIRSWKQPEKLAGTIIAAALFSTTTLLAQTALAAEPAYSVVSPLGEVNVEMIKMVPRLDTLSNKTVCLVSNSSFKVDVTMPAIEKELKRQFPGITVIPPEQMPLTELPGARPANWDAIPGEIAQKGCHAIVSGNGG